MAGTLAPALIGRSVLVPAELGQPSDWYRLLTYSLVQASFPHWLLIVVITLASGWLAERWLEPRTMWEIGAMAALVSGIIYVLLAPPLQPVIGGGFVAAGFAGAAVTATALRRRSVSRGARVVALALLLMYGLTPLQLDAQSLAMLGAFIAAGSYAAWRLRPLRPAAEGQGSAA